MILEISYLLFNQYLLSIFIRSNDLERLTDLLGNYFTKYLNNQKNNKIPLI